jgi:hypothetical protein
MDDENKLLEVDTRVRAAVDPPASVVDRVVKRALTDNDRRPQLRSRRPVAVVTVATAVLLIALTIWQGRERTVEHQVPTSLAITGDGSLLIVESHDGRRWIVGSVPKRPVGARYVIVVPH